MALLVLGKIDQSSHSATLAASAFLGRDAPQIELDKREQEFVVELRR
jgi:hypothetical protein